MQKVSVPEIKRMNLSQVILILKTLGINNLIDFDFIDKPEKSNVIFALENLFYLGALDQQGIITSLGTKLTLFPLDPSLSKLLLASVDLMCSKEVI